MDEDPTVSIEGSSSCRHRLVLLEGSPPSLHVGCRAGPSSMLRSTMQTPCSRRRPAPWGYPAGLTASLRAHVSCAAPLQWERLERRSHVIERPQVQLVDERVQLSVGYVVCAMVTHRCLTAF